MTVLRKHQWREQSINKRKQTAEKKQTQVHKQIHFFISSHTEVSAVRGNVRRSMLAGGCTAEQCQRGDTAGPQGGCRNLFCCCNNLMPPTFPAYWHRSDLNLLFPFLHDQIIYRVKYFVEFSIALISQFASLHTFHDKIPSAHYQCLSTLF